VPSALTRTVVDALIHDGEVRGRTALGITVGAIPEDAAAHYELPDGLYVSAVSKNSDAEDQGVKPGDIITAMNGEPLWSTDQIYEAKNALKVGDTINFTFWRNGKSFDLDIALVDYNDVY
jgi:S1-C subfamily serine protease